MSSIRRFLSLAYLLTSLPSAYSLCYFRNQTQVTDETYVACHDVVKGSYPWCCALNRPKQAGSGVFAIDARDVCLPNGLCQNAEDGTKFSYWREYCSNPEWDGCLKEDSPNGQFMSGNENVYLTSCDPKSWNTTQYCFGDNSTSLDCCKNWSSDHPQAVSVPLTLAAAATASPTSTPRPTRRPISKDDSSKRSKSGLSSGAIVGLVVGISIVMLGAGFFLGRRTGGKATHTKESEVPYPAHQDHKVYHHQQEMPAQDFAPRELDGQGVVQKP